MEPLVNVLKFVDQDKKPTMPYIYEAMDKAKKSIETIHNHKMYIKIIISSLLCLIYKMFYVILFSNVLFESVFSVD